MKQHKKPPGAKPYGRKKGDIRLVDGVLKWSPRPTTRQARRKAKQG